jgi:methylphosphotriester-DNA--protein-cysteine methyltransferase
VRNLTVVPPGERVADALVPLISGTPSTTNGAERVAAVVETNKGCLYVGSRNSDKYHLPSCAVTKRIKPENIVCFGNAEEAAKRGYVPGCIR